MGFLYFGAFSLPPWLLAPVFGVMLGSFSARFWFVADKDIKTGRHTDFGLFLGMWALPVLFSLMYRLDPDSCLAASSVMTEGDYLYFSYTTYTTLGYGDILPLGHCRLLTSIQAITGYIFLAYLAALFLERFKRVSLNSTEK